MTKDFSQVMSERTDKQLVDIVMLKRDEYQAEAIFAAEKEIEKRKINPGSFYTIEQVNEIQNPVQINKEEKEFEWYHKVATILLPACIIALTLLLDKVIGQKTLFKIAGFPLIIFLHYIIYRNIKDKGYTKLADNFLKWINYSLFIYIALLIVLGLTIFFFFM